MTTSVLTKVECLEMQLMRDRLKAISGRVQKQGLASDDGQWGVMSYGRALTALDVAESSLFDVLNILASYLHCDECDRAIKQRHGKTDA